MIKFKQFHVTEKYKKKAYEETCDCDCGESPCVTCGKDHHEVEESSCGKKHRKEAVSMSSIKKEIASLKKDKSVSEKEAIQMLKTIYPKNKNDIDKLWKEALDPVNKKALMKKFKNRKDKDIDNDGDVDKSDEYLHRRRKAVSRALETEEGDLKDACWDGYKAVGMKKKNGKMVPNCVPEENEIDEAVKGVTKKELDALEDRNEHGLVALKLAKAYGTPAEVKKIQDINKRHNQRGHIEYKDQKERDAITRKYWKMVEDFKEEVEVEEGANDYFTKVAGNMAGRHQQAVDRAVSIIRGAVKNGVKPEKAYAEWEKKSALGPKLKDQVKSRVLPKVMRREEVELDEGKTTIKTDHGTVHITTRDTKGMRGHQDKYSLTLHDKKGNKVNLGSHPNPTDSAVKSIVSRHFKEETVNERELTSGEEKKKEEIVKSMKKKMDSFEDRYGDRAKSVMYATATKMAKKS